MRKKIEAGIKLRAALEAYKGEKPMAEIGSKYGVHPNMVTRWKHELMENGISIFDSKKDQSAAEKQEKIDELHKNIGELTMERDWLKKIVNSAGIDIRKKLFDKKDGPYSQNKQCELLGINKSTLYYHAPELCSERGYNLYIRLAHGFAYLVAVIDWYSRRGC